ncbi:hypothetical protein ZWY2020_024927 [Hordeum vulgare]|nr:hypothetical protein ZWY2020_024927 [Hordeum vulgare]
MHRPAPSRPHRFTCSGVGLLLAAVMPEVSRYTHKKYGDNYSNVDPQVPTMSGWCYLVLTRRYHTSNSSSMSRLCMSCAATISSMDDRKSSYGSIESTSTTHLSSTTSNLTPSPGFPFLEIIPDLSDSMPMSIPAATEVGEAS